MTPAPPWPDAHSARGLVATPHMLASEAGVAVLQRGGNALDAAIAAAATIAVVYPHMNGIGGDNVWLIYDAARGALRGLNAAGRAAAAADREGYLARFGPAIPVRGGVAALTVPGTVSGWAAAHGYSRDVMGSRVKWDELLADAVRHAREGIAVSAGQRRVTAAAADLFSSAADADVRRSLWPIYHPDRLGTERFVQADLATTLAHVASDGAEEFYRGALARRLAEAASRAGSPLAAADLAEHRADWVEPLRLRYREGEAVSLPPPTQGFAALAILALLEGFDVASLDDTDHVHLAVEATKLALEDRDRYLADPTVVDVPVARCLDPDRVARRRALISRRAARPVDGRPADGDTIAIVTADAAGNAVSMIQSLYHEFGSGVVAGDTGVLLQNRGAYLLTRPAPPQSPGAAQAHRAHAHPVHVSGRRSAAPGVRHDGRRRAAADAGRARHARGRSWARPAVGDRGAALALRPHVGRDLARPAHRKPVRSGSRRGAAPSRPRRPGRGGLERPDGARPSDPSR